MRPSELDRAWTSLAATPTVAPVAGAPGPAGPCETLVELLRARAAADPQRATWTFLPDGLEPEAVLTLGELDARARAVAALLQERRLDGQPVLLAFPPGLDFLAAFFGCLYAGAVAVPVQAPEHPRGLPRLAAIARDSGTRLGLTTAAWRERLGRRVDPRGELSGIAWLPLEEVSAEAAGRWRDPGATADGLAFLQYTSGSTAEPKGVAVAHGHLLANEAMIQEAFEQGPETVVLGWLPLFHDMGLVGTLLQPLWSGGRCLLMAPATFLQRPLVWLEAISRHRATTSGGPSFAYELCARRAAVDPSACAALDLSCWRIAFNGAEPVRAVTMERFATAFAPCGFRRDALRPCYGLAEATLLVSAGRAVVRRYDTGALERGQAVRIPGGCSSGSVSGEEGDGSPQGEVPDGGAPGAGGARELAASGRPAPGQTVAIVDPQTRRLRPEGMVGEIWVAGPSVAAGYWRRAEASAATFAACLADGAGPFLRTGDLGFLDGGDLFVTGRIKELLVVRGRNLYPHDLERTAEEAHKCLRLGGASAFAIEGEVGEEVALVLEVERRAVSGPLEEVLAAVRQALAEAHEVQPRMVALLRPGTVPKTSSGKTRRRACAAAWAAGELEPLAVSAFGVEAVEEPQVGVAPAALAEQDAPGYERGRQEPEALLRVRLGRLLGIPPGELPGGAALTALGLDSLRAVELAHAVEAATGVVLPLERLLDGTTLAQLARELEGRLAGEPAEGSSVLAPPGATHGAGAAAREVEGTGNALPARGGARELPLSRGQSALWLLQRLAPGSSAWNLRFAARLGEGVDPAALGRALGSLVARHPLLRARVERAGGEPVLSVAAPGELELPSEDAREWSKEELARRLAQAADRPFDLAAGPPLRAELYRLRDGWALGLTLHHLVADLWSLAVLVEELAALYGAEREGVAAELPPPPDWAAYVAWQEELLAGDGGERLLAFWRRQLAAAPVLELPADGARVSRPGRAAGAVPFAFDPRLAARLENLAREEGTTLFAVLLAALQTLLHRLGGTDDLVVGSPAAGRGRADFSRLVGYCANLLPLRGDLAGDPTFRQLLQRAGASVRAALAHQDLPFPVMVEALRPPRQGRHPFFDVVLAFERPQSGAAARDLAAFALGQPGARLELGELVLESLALPPADSQFDLLFTVAQREGGLAGSLEYRRDLFTEATAECLARQLERLLESAADEPESRLSALPLLGPEERRRLLEACNATATPYPRATVHDLFAEVAAAHPGRTALELGDQCLSYGELAARSRDLARRLRRLGIGRGELVAVALSPSFELVVALLATLEAGGAYLPLDPGDPRERLAWMLEDARARVLVTHRDLLPVLPAAGLAVVTLEPPEAGAGGPVVAGADATPDGGKGQGRGAAAEGIPIDRREAAGPGTAPGRPQRPSRPEPPPVDDAGDLPEDLVPEDLAYVMYTSGSTGRPKGTAVPHRAVVRLVCETSYARFGADEVFLQLAPASFDAATFEIWGALLHGAKLAIAPARTSSPEELEELLRRHGVTTLWLTAGLFHLVAERRPQALAGLRQLLAGGDVLSPQHVARVRDACPAVTLINGYGPTEGTTFTCCHAIEAEGAPPPPPSGTGPEEGEPREEGQGAGAPIPIGRPIANTRVYVVDPGGEPVPGGVPGELLIGGDGLAWGYLHRPGLTAERFVPDPFGPPGGRLYHTGDRVRRRPDGALEYLGRLDAQVKVRGFRVEPGEIEAVLRELPAVAAAAVVARERGGSRDLVAYLVPRGERPAPEVLRRALGHFLPDFMVPAAFLWLPELPLNANGKVDRRRLPEPGPQRPELEVPYAAPLGEVEGVVARLWGEALGVERVGRDDNFFDLGGHSLLLARLHGRLEEELGKAVPIVELFAHPTVAALARHLATGARAGDASGGAGALEAGAVARAAQRRAAVARRGAGRRTSRS